MWHPTFYFLVLEPTLGGKGHIIIKFLSNNPRFLTDMCMCIVHYVYSTYSVCMSYIHAQIIAKVMCFGTNQAKTFYMNKNFQYKLAHCFVYMYRSSPYCILWDQLAMHFQYKPLSRTVGLFAALCGLVCEGMLPSDSFA